MNVRKSTRVKMEQFVMIYYKAMNAGTAQTPTLESTVTQVSKH